MSLFKCKMCGGDLEIVEGASIAECEYCGTAQPVPKVVDGNLKNLFNRANALRIKSEFDKAEKIYERIIQADSTQADAYWGLILCKYGIEYVDDPETYEKIPTCHRASYDSVIADDDYKAALANADMSQRILYEKQAHEIDRIQKDILALAQQEEAYDVFICYKETDPSGARTHDSVIANDIYHQLTGEGFKVFYAAITLEGKLGSAYEPIIFAALNSAKVMLAIGTKPEYFTAVWVKNEWSRYLKIVKQDHSKLLIPCYRDMDAYELPEEFAHLQAQDMSKIGFINDLIRGIKKVTQKDEPKVVETTVVQQTVVAAGDNPNTASLMKRAFMFLEDGDWASAKEYCEKVLDIDPENAEAYLGKLMAEIHVCKKDDLINCKETFEKSDNFKKAVRFGDVSLKKFLNDCIKTIVYNKAMRMLNQAVSKSDFLQAEIAFKSISDFKDATEKANEASTAWERRIDKAKMLAEQFLTLRYDISPIKSIEQEIATLKHRQDDNEKFKVEYPKHKALLDSYLSQKNELKFKIHELETQITDLENEKYSLGLFSFMKKQIINDQIIDLQFKITEIKVQLESISRKITQEQIVIKQYDPIECDKRLVDILSKIQTKQNEFETIKSQNYRMEKEFNSVKKELQDIRYLSVLWDDVSLLRKLIKDQDILNVFKHTTISMPPHVYVLCGMDVKFGKYPQGINGEIKDIEWRVIDYDNISGKGLYLISRYALDYQCFCSNTLSATYWASSTLRYWLHREFLGFAFSEEERKKIISTTVIAQKNPVVESTYDGPANPGPNTEDNIFLLGISDVKKIFKSDQERRCIPTDYCKARGCRVDENNYCNWVLRTPGSYSAWKYNAYVRSNGEIAYMGEGVTMKMPIRPVIQIRLDSNIY